jgi:hypothetical protein
MAAHNIVVSGFVTMYTYANFSTVKQSRFKKKNCYHTHGAIEILRAVAPIDILLAKDFFF